ncbi:MAG: hypothetical protein IT328_13120 [Caldilineaceae bacterium]|nr:hypothetical protein [Caldilineaceae bacterium]
MALLADYRSDLHNLLATTVDASTWSNALLDEALRRGLGELNLLLVYETSFTVESTGYEQDLSSLTGIYAVLAAAYPWQEGWDFARTLTPWRSMGQNKLYFTAVEPAVGETIRVRHSKLHTIEDLDSATATTVPDAQRALVGLWAAAFACELRQRQISENPALPTDAGRQLAGMAMTFRKRAQEATSHIPPLGQLRWGNIGLE